MKCPKCGHTWTNRKLTAVSIDGPIDASPDSTDVSSMSDKELFDYRKRTAPFEDVKFYLRGHVYPEVKEFAEGLLRSGKAPSKKDRSKLAQIWRGCANRAAGTKVA